MKPQPQLRPQVSKPPRNKSRRTRSIAIIGLLAAVAVFVCLEGLSRSGDEPYSAEKAKTGSLPQKPKKATSYKPVGPDTSATPEENAKPTPVPEAAPRITEAKPEIPTDKWAKETLLVLTGKDAVRDAAVKRDKELLDKAVNSGAWKEYRELLARSIRAGMDNLDQGKGLNRFDVVWNEAILYRALLRWRTLGTFIRPGFEKLVTDSYTGAYLLWLLDQPAAMEELHLTIQPTDDSVAALKLLMDCRALDEALFEKYHSLALACAVVFDRAMPIDNPVGASGSGNQSTVAPLDRYHWYVQKNEKGKLAAPVHHSSARDLVWVVCAPVSTSELDWAISKMSGHRKNWGKNYGEIEYLMERAVEGLNPYKEYSFAEILKHGGICGDQTYFCVNTARAQGIPAMGLSGETDSGGHAWAGLKIDDREWTTSTGRIGGVSKGEAYNPQKGMSITEQEILHWNDRQLRSPAITLSVFRHLWLADFFAETSQDKPKAETIRLANKLGPSFTETWQALYSLLESEVELTGIPAKPNNLDEWKAFAADMRREYKDNPRMAGLAANAEMEYIFPYGPEGDAERALLRERRRIQRESSEQADLIAGSLKRQADLIHKKGGPDAKLEIGRLYDRALRDYGGSITGFKDMAENYFSFMRDDTSSARKAARDIELAFKRVVETGTKDFFRAEVEASIYRMICGYYRTAGDPKRAEMLEKRYEIQLRRAKRGAL